MKISLPLNIEIPSNPTDFNLGLMFRESLDQNSGMLFVFEEMGQKSFHMKDTKIPLDIAFVKEDGTIGSRNGVSTGSIEEKMGINARSEFENKYSTDVGVSAHIDHLNKVLNENNEKRNSNKKNHHDK